MAAISATPIDETGCPEVINVANLQMLPGFLDTHRQSGLARRPRLKESVRRGVTTVTFGLCSIARYQSDLLRLRASREAELRLALEALLPRWRRRVVEDQALATLLLPEVARALLDGTASTP